MSHHWPQLQYPTGFSELWLLHCPLCCIIQLTISSWALDCLHQLSVLVNVQLLAEFVEVQYSHTLSWGVCLLWLLLQMLDRSSQMIPLLWLSQIHMQTAVCAIVHENGLLGSKTKHLPAVSRLIPPRVHSQSSRRGSVQHPIGVTRHSVVLPLHNASDNCFLHSTHIIPLGLPWLG